MIDIYQGGNSRVRYIQIDIWWLRLRKRSRLGPLSRLPRKSGVRRFKSLVSWDCRIFWRYITAAVIYTIQFATSSQCLRGVRYEARHKEEAGNESSPRSIYLLFSIEMQEQRTRLSIRLFQDASIVQENFIRDQIVESFLDLSNLSWRRINWNIRGWNLFFFSPPSTKLIGGSDPSRGSPREIRSGGQSGLIKRY